MRFNSTEEAKAWETSHEGYLRYEEDRVQRCHGVWFTRRELVRKRGPARIVGIGTGNRPVITCELKENGVAPDNWRKTYQRFA